MILITLSTASRIAAPNYSHWQVAYIDASSGSLFLSRGDGSQRVLIAKNGAKPVWSPDGRMLAFWQNHKVLVHDFKTGANKRIAALNGIEPTQMSFDPNNRILDIPLGDAGIKLAGLDGHDHGIYKGFHRRGDVTAVSWDALGSRMLFTSDGDIWIGSPGGKDGEDIPDWELSRFYVTANRLAPLAFFNDSAGASASTPFWVDGLAWFPGASRLLFHYQRHGGSGVSYIGIVQVEPHPYNPKDSLQVWMETLNGYDVKVRWIDTKEMVFGPAVCPDGKTISIWKPSDDSYLELVDENGKTIRRLIKDAQDAVWRPNGRTNNVANK